MPLIQPTGPFSVACLDIHSSTLSSFHSQQVPFFFRLFYPLPQVFSDNELTENMLMKKKKAYWLPNTLLYSRGYAHFLNFNAIAGLAIVGGLLRNATIHAYENIPFLNEQAKESEEQKKYSLILFSHGLGGMRTTYSNICIELASYGYIVVSIEHLDGSACVTTTANGSTLWYRDWKSSRKSEFKFRNEQLSYRISEVKSIIQWLQNESCEWNEVIDWENVSIMGHSFGGATAFKSSQEMSIFKRVVTLDPWMMPFEMSEIEGRARCLPTLVISSESFHWPENLQRLEKYLSTNTSAISKHLILQSANHYSQSDWPLIVPNWVSTWTRLNTAINAKLLMEYNLEAIICFLTGKESDILNGTHQHITLSYSNIV